MAESTGTACKRTSEQEDDQSPQGRFRYLPVADLKPDPRNPRKHTRTQVRAIAKSIEAFGFNSPILIDRGRQIVAGHGRLEAARLLGYEKVPVVSLDHLNKEQARAYMLTDNKLTDRSCWDDQLLAVHLKELSLLSLDFDIEATGFELPEIDFRIQSLDGDEADEAEEFGIAQGPATTRLNDLWLLGESRLLCGSALDKVPYQRLLDKERAAGVFTDPPYNVKIDGHVSGNGAIKHREFAMASGEMSKPEFSNFLSETMKLVGTFAEAGAVIYSCMDWRHLDEMSAGGRAAGFELLNVCVWVKSNGGMGSLYRSQHEFVFVFRNGSVPHRNNVQLGRFGRNRSTTWFYPGANSFPRKGRKRGLDLHPTSKPIALVADAILDTTKRGDIILDPFLGGGTTILAAQRTGRRGYGIELDPLYVDTAIERWQAMTGQSAQHESGSSFEEIRALRSGLVGKRNEP